MIFWVPLSASVAARHRVYTGVTRASPTVVRSEAGGSRSISAEPSWAARVVEVEPWLTMEVFLARGKSPTGAGEGVHVYERRSEMLKLINYQ